MRYVFLVMTVGVSLYGQAMMDATAAAAGGIAGGAAGKKVNDGLNNVLGNVAKQTAKAAATAILSLKRWQWCRLLPLQRARRHPRLQ